VTDPLSIAVIVLVVTVVAPTFVSNVWLVHGHRAPAATDT